jgi:hypothetical protein
MRACHLMPCEYAVGLKGKIKGYQDLGPEAIEVLKHLP